jgi:hypothetical protein
MNEHRSFEIASCKLASHLRQAVHELKPFVVEERVCACATGPSLPIAGFT